MPSSSTQNDPSQITAYSFKPFIELTSDETKRLSAMTRNAKNVIYVTGFLANTKMNKNQFRITDNKYIDANRGMAAGRPINFGPKMLGKAHHPNFYRDLDIDGKTDEQVRKMFLEYQEWSRIGDILKIDYDKQRDQWKFYGAISHPNVVESIQNNTLQLPKYVSPYFWNLNDPKDTGPEIREAELFHVSFVDDPAYGVEAVASTCQPSEDGSVCAARVFGLPAGRIQNIESSKGVPPCMCGLMAAYENKTSSSLYIENPKLHRQQVMSDPNQPTHQPNNDKPENNGGNGTAEDPKPQTEALLKMKEYDKLANEGKADLNKDNSKVDDAKNPKIPIEFQDLVNVQIEKERQHMTKQNNKALQEKDEIINSLQKEIAATRAKEREGIISRYLQKDSFKEEGKFEERVKFYKDLKLSNEEVEAILKDHWNINETVVSVGHSSGGNSKGKGAARNNMDPFGFESGDQIGLLTTTTARKGLAASSNDDVPDVGPIETDNDDEGNESEDSKNGKAIIGAFS